MEGLEDQTVPATLSGTAFLDANGNGVQDTGENPVAGAVVTASPAAGGQLTDTSDTTGHYQIDGIPYGSCEVSITAPAGYTVLSPSGGTSAFYVSDPDNDAFRIDVGLGGGPPVVSMAPALTVAEGETGNVVFTRSGGDQSQSLTVGYTITAATATPGNPGDPGADYQTLSGSVTFDPNEGTAAATIEAFRDNLVEGDETIDLAISDGGTAYTVDPNAGTGTVTITDDPQVVSVVRGQDGTEGVNDGSFVFTRAGGDLTRALAVTYVLSGTATQGADYGTVSGTITIQPNDTTATLPIAVVADGIVEPTETVIATVTTDGTTYIIGANPATIFIFDTDRITNYGVFHWIAPADGDWMEPTNWDRDAVPGAGDVVFFDASYSVHNCDLHGPLNGSYGVAEMHVVNGYPGTITLNFPLTVQTLEMNPDPAAKIDQPGSVYGSDLTITSALLWTAGVLNSIDSGAAVYISGAAARIAAASTLYTASTLMIVSGAATTIEPGTIGFTGGDGVVVDNAGLTIAAVDDSIQFSKTNAGQDDKKVWIKTGGWVTVPGPKDYGNDGISLLNEGGTFTVKGGATAVFGGSVGPEGQAGSIRQTAGTIVIENGSILGASGAIYLAGGKLSTMARTTAGGPSFVASLFPGVTQGLTVAGATVEVGDPGYDPPGGAGHTFSTLSVNGNVNWTSGVLRVSTGWNAKGTPDGDLWNATGTFTITGGADGAKLGPRPSVNVGTHALTGVSWWVLYGLKGTTVSTNPQTLNFEIAAQGNDWENVNTPVRPGDINELKLTHK